MIPAVLLSGWRQRKLLRGHCFNSVAIPPKLSLAAVSDSTAVDNSCIPESYYTIAETVFAERSLIWIRGRVEIFRWCLLLELTLLQGRVGGSIYLQIPIAVFMTLL